MGAWTVNSLVAPVTRGTAAGSAGTVTDPKSPPKQPVDPVHVMPLTQADAWKVTDGNGHVWNGAKWVVAHEGQKGYLPSGPTAPPPKNGIDPNPVADPLPKDVNVNQFQSLMDQIFGGSGWRQYMGTQDRSGQVGNRGGISPEGIYNMAAANMLNTRNYMMQLANSTWNTDKTRQEMQRLQSMGGGIGMNNADAVRYEQLRQQYDDQMNQQAMRQQLAARVGSAPITPIQPPPPRTSGWGMGSNMMGIGGNWGI